MGRLIDADSLFESVGNIKPNNKSEYELLGKFMNMITYSPTVACPHGNWDWDGKAVKREMYIRECLHCKTKSAVGNFCMWCGADMRSEAE